MSLTIELDPVFRGCIKFLHSKSPDSAEKIRNSLDEMIKQRFGPNKMLANVLSKKILAEEISGEKRKQSSVKVAPVEEPIQDTPFEEPLIIAPNSDSDDEPVIEEDHLKELEDLMCQICRRMDINVHNRLVECVDCNSLYHQDCHNPKILDSEANDSTWHCASCKIQITKPTVQTTPTKSSHSSSSSSSTHKTKSSSKNYESSSSESSESKKSKSTSNSKISKSHSKSESSSNGSSKTVTPNINIISADKRLQIMKKKAAKLQETKRKHK